MQVRHDVGNGAADAPAQSQGIVSKWRQKERLKTTAVALVLCLNIGVDPPDVIKISPCARLECWVDPLSMQPPKALETIGAGMLDRACSVLRHRHTASAQAWLSDACA
jgi:regulatory associated protein of mTOR